MKYETWFQTINTLGSPDQSKYSLYILWVEDREVDACFVRCHIYMNGDTSFPGNIYSSHKKKKWKMNSTMIKVHTSGSEVLRCFDTKGFALTKPLSWVSKRQFHSISSSSTLVAARMITFLHFICKANKLSMGHS
jgi:hypothetical protein